MTDQNNLLYEIFSMWCLLFLMLPIIIVSNVSAQGKQLSYSFENETSSTPWISFEFYSNNRIFIPAKINGRQTSIILAPGATTSIIDKDLADVIGFSAYTDAFSSSTNKLMIQFGNLTLHDVNV